MKALKHRGLVSRRDFGFGSASHADTMRVSVIAASSDVTYH
jgi:hypothetical protein